MGITGDAEEENGWEMRNWKPQQKCKKGMSWGVSWVSGEQSTPWSYCFCLSTKFSEYKIKHLWNILSLHPRMQSGQNIFKFRDNTSAQLGTWRLLVLRKMGSHVIHIQVIFTGKCKLQNWWGDRGLQLITFITKFCTPSSQERSYLMSPAHIGIDRIYLVFTLGSLYYAI